MKYAIKTTLLAILLSSASATALLAQDVLTLGTGVQTGSSVDIPVYVRDVSGTALGVDQPAGSKIQSYSINVTYTTDPAIQSVTFTRAGILAGLTPTFETSPSSAGSITLLDTFNEATNLIPFVSNAAAPGNQIGHIVITFAPGTVTSPVITLTINPTLTQLSNQGGTTTETVANGRLTFVNGPPVIFAPVPVPTPTLDWRVLAVLGAILAFIGLRAARL